MALRAGNCLIERMKETMMDQAMLLVDPQRQATSMDMLHALQKLFAGYLDISEIDPDALTEDNVKGCKLLISHDYADLLHTSEDFAATLISYVAEGGGWLAIHGGTLVRNATGLTTLLGAKMVATLEENRCDFIITVPDHPAMAGTAPFTMTASAYQYEFSTIRPGPKQDRRALLYEYLHNGTVCTGGWTQEFGMGRVAGSALGVTVQEFSNPTYAKLIKKCGLWAAGLENT